MKLLGALGGAVVCIAPALAQSVQPVPAAPPTAAPSNAGMQPSTILQSVAVPMMVGGPQTAMLRTGTQVPLKLDEELTTKEKRLKAGQRFNMEVTAPVLVDGQTVIPLGAPAVGEITDVRNKGMWGKSGHLVAQVLYVTVNGRQIKLTGTFDDKGHAGGGAAIATSAVVFLPAGFFMTGTSAKVPIGMPVTGFIGEDVPLAFAGPTTQTPMVVPASVTPSSSPTGALVNAPPR